ncbi:MAG: ATP-dependent Clp protease adaptor ClpS [Caulobacteraceae bacterium]|nr:MAG: ATP-dependent Clp protease adaptor ClpS [Caulobacteraceae bacterium]
MQFLSEAGDLRPGGRPIGAPRLKAEGPVRVDLLNDDKTPMEFVVHVLQQSFGIRYVEAVQVMLTIHTEGRASAGSFARETADAIFEEVTGLARSEGFPLQLELITEAAD